MRRLTGLVVVVMISACAPAFAQEAGDLTKQPVIVTRGQASLKRAPDQAWVSIAAESRASASAEAQRLNAEAMQAVTAALTRAGLPAEAIRTTGYSLQPDMEYVSGRGRVKGYIARNQLEVRVDDLKKLGAVLDAAGLSGATSMSGLRFDISNRASVEREALGLAVQDAMARARAIASGAGVTVGPIVRIDDQYQSSPPMYAMGAGGGARLAAAPPETPISAGELEVRAEVMMTVVIR
jgi:uncharacterized protein YggE